MDWQELPTPALCVDAQPFQANLDAMAAALPGARCRPHVKAHKCTELAKRQLAVGHAAFTAATPREIIGLAHAGLTNDLLLANECVNIDRLSALAALDAIDAQVTVAVDSDTTILAAAAAGLRSVLIDVNVGLPRCGCAPDDAGRLADLARRHGLHVRGVMGYEGHVVGIADYDERVAKGARSMERLAAAHALTGGDVISAGGTGTYATNTLATEIQAGSYALMDSSYAELDLPFLPAMFVSATVVSVNADFAVADCGLKSLGMDHGNPTIASAVVHFCSDEHITFTPSELVHVGDRIRVWPAHVDPTVAYHERMHVISNDAVIDEWPIDLRGW